MNTLLEQIKKKNAKAFTHSGKFHADDVFSYALLLYLNPAITITRGNKVPKDFDGIVFDIGRGKYDHHQKIAASAKMEYLMQHSDFSGKNLAKKFLAKNLLQSSMSHSSSHLITTITPAKKMNLLH